MFEAPLIVTISWVHALCGLPSAPTESEKMQDFGAAQDSDD